MKARKPHMCQFLRNPSFEPCANAAHCHLYGVSSLELVVLPLYQCDAFATCNNLDTREVSNDIILK